MKKGIMLSKMLVIATNAHAGVFDKGGAPYILHPLKVMHYLKTDDEEMHCGALGHDLFEDTMVTAHTLREEGISERVINMITRVTKVDGETEEEYEAKVLGSIDSIKLKMADLRHNSDIRRMKSKGDITEKDIKRTIRYMRFYDKLEGALLKNESKG